MLGSLLTAPTGTTVMSATKLRKTGDGNVNGYLIVERNTDFASGATLATLPVGWRPSNPSPDGQEFVALVSNGGQSSPVVCQVLNTGVVRAWSPAGGWVNNRRLTVNLSFATV